MWQVKRLPNKSGNGIEMRTCEVSLFIPVYNDKVALGPAILESLRHLVALSDSFELLIAEDGYQMTGVRRMSAIGGERFPCSHHPL